MFVCLGGVVGGLLLLLLLLLLLGVGDFFVFCCSLLFTAALLLFLNTFLKILIHHNQPIRVKQRSKDVTQTQQQRLESPTVTLTSHASKYKDHKLH